MSKYARTEEGLRQAYAYLQQARVTSDLRAQAETLLELSWLVKWVQFDDTGSFFGDSERYALQSADIYLKLGDRAAQGRALLAAATFDIAVMKGRVAEVFRIATELEDETLMADVLAARGRITGSSESLDDNHSALELYRKQGRKSGVARTLFTLAIHERDDKVSRAWALEAGTTTKRLNA